jgi:two-component system chemotaxis response regulator CheY
MKALVIDDSRATRAILRRMLSAAGFGEVVEASDGGQGLERLREGALPDVALVDWNMPVMNGIQFVEALRRERQMDAVRILFVTSETEIDRVQQALAAGANEYLMKPFSPEALRAKLELMGVGIQGEP